MGNATSPFQQEGCRACAALESHEQWRALPLVRSMSQEDLAAYMTTPWNGRAIEVRRCQQCGRAIARAVPARPPAG